MNSMMNWRPTGVITATPMTLSPDAALHIVGVPAGSVVSGVVSGVLTGAVNQHIPATYAPPMGGSPGYYSIALGNTPLAQGQNRVLVDVAIALPDGTVRSASVGAGDGITMASFDLFRAASSLTNGEKWALGIGGVVVVGALAAWGLSSGKTENPGRRRRR